METLCNYWKKSFLFWLAFPSRGIKLLRNGILWRRYFHYHKWTLKLEGETNLPLIGPRNNVALACFDSFCGIRWELFF